MRFVRIGLPLVFSGSVSALLIVILHHYFQYQGGAEDVSSWGAFFNVFGVIYAIVAGFVLITVLSRYSALSQTIEDELNAVESVRDFLVYLDDEQQGAAKKSLLGALAAYTASVANTEWGRMSDPGTAMDSDTSEELYEVMRRGKEIRLLKESDSVVLAQLVQSTSEIAKTRTRRIALANEKLPPRLRVLLLFMSAVLIAGFFFMGVQSIAVHIFMIVALTVSVHLLYWIIEDLDHPFYGVWNITRAPLDELARNIHKAATAF